MKPANLPRILFRLFAVTAFILLLVIFLPEKSFAAPGWVVNLCDHQVNTIVDGSVGCYGSNNSWKCATHAAQGGLFGKCGRLSKSDTSRGITSSFYNWQTSETVRMFICGPDGLNNNTNDPARWRCEGGTKYNEKDSKLYDLYGGQGYYNLNNLSDILTNPNYCKIQLDVYKVGDNPDQHNPPSPRDFVVWRDNARCVPPCTSATTPGTPTELTPNGTTYTSIANIGLSWTAGAANLGTCPGAETKYVVNVVKVGTSNTPIVSNAVLNTPSYTINSSVLAGDGTYSWTVKQCNNAANTQCSNEASATFTISTLNASCVSHTIPTTMTAGNTYSVNVTMKNNGGSAWIGTGGTPVRLGTRSTTNWGITRVYLPTSPVNVGVNTSFDFFITAPLTAGTYSSQWQMVQETIKWFGDLCGPNAITVVAPPNAYLTGYFFIDNGANGGVAGNGIRDGQEALLASGVKYFSMNLYWTPASCGGTRCAPAAPIIITPNSNGTFSKELYNSNATRSYRGRFDLDMLTTPTQWNGSGIITQLGYGVDFRSYQTGTGSDYPITYNLSGPTQLFIGLTQTAGTTLLPPILKFPLYTWVNYNPVFSSYSLYSPGGVKSLVDIGPAAGIDCDPGTTYVGVGQDSTCQIPNLADTPFVPWRAKTKTVGGTESVWSLEALFGKDTVPPVIPLAYTVSPDGSTANFGWAGASDALSGLYSVNPFNILGLYRASSSATWVGWEGCIGTGTASDDWRAYQNTSFSCPLNGTGDYLFSVGAFDLAGNWGSSQTTPINVTPPCIDTTPPSVPNNLRPNAVCKRPSTFNTAWDTSVDPSFCTVATVNYIAELSLSNTVKATGEFTSPLSTPITINTSGSFPYAVADLSSLVYIPNNSPKTVYFHVRSRDSSGNISNWSSVVSQELLADPVVTSTDSVALDGTGNVTVFAPGITDLRVSSSFDFSPRGTVCTSGIKFCNGWQIERSVPANNYYSEDTCVDNPAAKNISNTFNFPSSTLLEDDCVRSRATITDNASLHSVTSLGPCHYVGYTSWFQSINGDVYGTSISEMISSSPSGGYESWMIANDNTTLGNVNPGGLAISSGTVSVLDTNFVNKSSERWTISEYTGGVEWPTNVFSALTQSDSNSFLVVYEAGDASIKRSGATNMNGDYDAGFLSGKVLVVTNGNITVSGDLRSSDPAVRTSDLSSFLVAPRGTITIADTENGNDTIRIRGGIYAKDGFIFNRNLQNNKYPSITVSFDPAIFARALNKLSVSRITWKEIVN